MYMTRGLFVVAALLQAVPNSLAQTPPNGCSREAPFNCVTVHKPDKVSPGYTLLSQIISDWDTYLVDMEGNLTKKWPQLGYPPKFLPNGHIVLAATYYLNKEYHLEDDCIFQLDWSGKVVWPTTKLGWLPSWCTFSSPTAWRRDEYNRWTIRLHHDWQTEGSPVGYYAPGQDPKPLGTGRLLILAHDNPPLAQTAHISDVPLEDEALYEIAADGRTIEWTWLARDHVEQFGFSPIARRAIMEAHAPFTQVNPFSTVDVLFDWLHMNSASWLGRNKWCPDPDNLGTCDLRFHPRNIIVDSRHASFIAIIARFDHPQRVWASGDVVWRLGPDFTGFEGGDIIGQHHAHMIPEGLPGAGNILLFDNGGFATYGAGTNGEPAWPTKTRSYSRILEINPMTLKVVWEYARPRPAAGERYAFFSSFDSSAQRLENGNTLIGEGLRGRAFEVTPAGEIVWEFVSPFGKSPPGGTVASLGFGNSLYRAYRVPPQWVPAP